jgi:membrane-associated protease RseP (regulator of RpoE activity)
MWLVLVGIIALLFGCVLGALGGGLAGFFAGRAAAQRGEARIAVAPEGWTRPGQDRPWDESAPDELPAPEITTVPQEGGLPWRSRGGSGETVARVSEVTAGSPAEEAGLEVGDLIIAVDGEPLDGAEGLAAAIAAYAPGDEIELTIQRDGEESTLTLTLGENPKKSGVAWAGITYRLVSLDAEANGGRGDDR